MDWMFTVIIAMIRANIPAAAKTQYIDKGKSLMPKKVSEGDGDKILKHGCN